MNFCEVQMLIDRDSMACRVYQTSLRELIVFSDSL